MTHTPAPWIVDDAFDTGGTYDICYKDGNNISVIAHTLHTGNGNHKANAKLICASPDLLKALKICVKEYYETCQQVSGADDSNIYPTPDYIIFAETVIKQAEGK